MCSSFFHSGCFFVIMLKKYISQSTQVRGGHACRVSFHLVAVSWLALGCTLLAEVQDIEFSSPSRAHATGLYACQADSGRVFQGLERNNHMDAIVRLVRAVASGRWLTVYAPAHAQSIREWHCDGSGWVRGGRKHDPSSVLLGRGER